MKTFKRETIAEVITHLTLLGEGKRNPRRKFDGLCQELGHLISNAIIPGIIIVKKHSLTWKHYNGNDIFPIGNGRDDYNRTGSLWDRRTKRGKLRRDLCLHIAAELKKEYEL